jgi:hypothetical protein
MVPTNLKHYLGRGTDHAHGLGPNELASAIKLTKESSPSPSKVTMDRGLTTPSSRVLLRAAIGPGSYNNDQKLAFPQSKSSMSNSPYAAKFGRERRNTHFAKYAEQNFKIYTSLH